MIDPEIQGLVERMSVSMKEATAAASGLADGLGGPELVRQTRREVAQYRRIVDGQLEKVAQLQANLRR